MFLFLFVSFFISNDHSLFLLFVTFFVCFFLYSVGGRRFIGAEVAATLRTKRAQLRSYTSAIGFGRVGVSRIAGLGFRDPPKARTTRCSPPKRT